MRNLISGLYDRLLDAIQESDVVKARYEIKYWKGRLEEEGVLSYDHYEYFYTAHFDLTRAAYQDKKILDIGCGPRGSLEWADMALERVGLDPLADEYKKLGTHRHKMKYVTGGAETIPFPDNYFDVVVSFNSLDHVDDLAMTIREIVRVISPGRLLLLLTDVHPHPTICEPVVFSWDVVERFANEMSVLAVKHYEKRADGMYQSIKAGIPFDHSDTSPRYGVLSAKFLKPA